jgi:hypothetical protein
MRIKSNMLLLVLFAIGLGFGIAFSEYWQGDNGRSFIGFGLVYGWLALFAVLAWIQPQKERTLLVTGSAPLALLAVTSVVLSFPVHVLPFLSTLAAISRARDHAG